jgi:L-ascorbate metabolism protein UlaG (beta-lactamase superfamily)
MLIASYYATKGFQAHPMNHGGSWNFDFGKVKYVNVHSSSFLMALTEEIQAVLLSRRTQKHLHRGRYGPTMDMKLIPMRTKLDLAILPIGDNFTMDIEDAIVASDFIECKVVGYHYDTFGYIEMIIKQPFKSFPIGKDLMLLKIGESIEL